MTELHNPGNEAPIDKLYVFMSIDDKGAHGILGSVLPELGSTPLVTGSARAAEMMKPLAARIGREAGVKVGMFVFNRTDMVWSEP